MMKFALYFIDKTHYVYNSVKYCKAKIVIDTFEEMISIPIEYWSVEEYENQWQEAIHRLKKYNQTCLIIKIRDPNYSKYILMWIIYKEKNKLIFRNQMFIKKIYSQRFGNKKITALNCYDFIPRRSSLYEGKYKISEWYIDLPQEFFSSYTKYQKGYFRIRKHRSKWSL